MIILQCILFIIILAFIDSLFICFLRRFGLFQNLFKKESENERMIKGENNHGKN